MTERRVPMAPVQLEAWHAEMSSAATPEHVCGAIRLRGHVEVDALSLALDAVVARHDEAEAVDIISPGPGNRIPADAAPLWRVSLMRLPDGDHVLGYVFHHIIMDGWSLYVFLADLGDAYSRAISGQNPSLSPLQYTFADYCADERRMLGTGQFKDVLAHWRRILPAALPELRLPRDGERRDELVVPCGALDILLDASATEQMEQHARASRCTVFTLLLDAVAVALGEHGATDEIIVGVPFHNRTKRQLRPLIGCIVNDVPIPMTGIRGRRAERDRLDYAKSVTAAALRYPTVPWPLLKREIYGVTDAEPYPPFPFSLNVQAPPGIEYGLTGVEMTEVPLNAENSFHFFELNLWRDSDHIDGELTYDADLYSRSRIEGLWASMKGTLLTPTS
jgi:hypothetical protein